MDQVASSKSLPANRLNAWLVPGLSIAVFAALWIVAGGVCVWAAGALVAAIGPALCAAALLLLPGLALLRLLWPGPLAPIERWPLAIALSCASVPLLVLGGSLVGLRWNPLTAWLLIVLALGVAVWPGRSADWRRTAGRLQTYRPGTAQLLLMLITALALALRLYLVRDLPAGMFGDSYHHTLITQLLIDHGGLFQSWEPYAPLKTMTYHFGFHSVAAFLSLLTGLPAMTTTLVVGQIEGALAAPLLFLLTLRLLRDERAALFAALLAAFVSIMPAYYVNWGRYTQLGGQTVLVAALVAWMALLDGRWTMDDGRQYEERSSVVRRLSSTVHSLNNLATIQLLILTALATAGLALTHYRVAVFAVCFVLVYAAYCMGGRPGARSQEPGARSQEPGARSQEPGARSQEPGARSQEPGAGPVPLRGAAARVTVAPLPSIGATWPVRGFAAARVRLGHIVVRSILAGLLAGLLVLPWLLRLREGALLKIGGYYLANSVAVDTPLTNAFDLYVQPFMAGLAVIGLILLLVQREWRVLLLPAWAVALWLAANPAQIGLPGTGIVSGVAVLVGSYLIVVPLAAAGLAAGTRLVCSLVRRSALLAAAQLAIGVLLAVWGLRWQQHMLTPQTQLLYQADLRAFDWIKRETPADAHFFVNSFSAFGGGVYVGSDGGWWLPYLTGRSSNVPPATYGTEAGERPDYQMWVQNDNAAILAHPLNSAEAAQALKAAGYGYLYDGPGNSAPASNEYIRPAELARSPFYQIVYNAGGVTIWNIR